MANDSLGLIGYDSYTFVVGNIERSRKFYTSTFDFREVAHASRELCGKTGEQAIVFGAGTARVVVTSPLTQGSASARYLRLHPAGIPTLSFAVRDLDQTRKFLAARNATFLGDDVDAKNARGGRYRSFSIATPLGDVSFRFVERTDFPEFAPGFESVDAPASTNRYGIQCVDHVTSNARTMGPLISFYREVLGMEEFWRVNFHTEDVSPGKASGTGLRSIVMREPESNIKFASNEPLAPFYEDSQIARFCYDNHGPGVQHIAFSIPAIIDTVADLRGRGIGFLSTPTPYYKHLPERLEKLNIRNVKEDLRRLEELEILVDGADDKYMLQIFLREAAATYDDERAGPFFYELIQRAGDEGFGYGNFRALFESIEREQRSHTSPPG